MSISPAHPEHLGHPALGPHRVTTDELAAAATWDNSSIRTSTTNSNGSNKNSSSKNSIFSPKNKAAAEEKLAIDSHPQTRRRFFTLKEQQVRDWIEQVLQINLGVDTPAQLAAAMQARGGRLLARLVAALLGRSGEALGAVLGQIPDQENLPYNQKLELVTAFLQACRQLGVAESMLFEPHDLINGRNIVKVIYCLQELAVVARRRNDVAPSGVPVEASAAASAPPLPSSPEPKKTATPKRSVRKPTPSRSSVSRRASRRVGEESARKQPRNQAKAAEPTADSETDPVFDLDGGLDDAFGDVGGFDDLMLATDNGAGVGALTTDGFGDPVASPVRRTHRSKRRRTGDFEDGTDVVESLAKSAKTARTASPNKGSTDASAALSAAPRRIASSAKKRTSSTRRADETMVDSTSTEPEEPEPRRRRTSRVHDSTVPTLHGQSVQEPSTHIFNRLLQPVLVGSFARRSNLQVPIVENSIIEPVAPRKSLRERLPSFTLPATFQFSPPSFAVPASALSLVNDAGGFVLWGVTFASWAATFAANSSDDF